MINKKKYIALVFSLILFATESKGQLDTTSLNTIVVSGNENPYFFTKASSIMPESASHTLRNKEAVYIKEGSGKMLSSIRIAGATAAQTAAVWNGLTLNNPLNGQIDLSLVPGGLMQLGVSNLGSSYFGSSSLMGAILLEQARFDSQTLIDLNYGSFGTKNLRVVKGIKGAIASHTLSFGAHHSLNNYAYTNLIAQPEQRNLENAQATIFNMLYGTEVLLTNKLKLEGNAWFSNSNRGLPTISTVPADSAFQKDEAWRAQLALKYEHKSLQLTLSNAVGIENLRFVIPKTGLNSFYKTLQQVNMLSMGYRINQKLKVKMSMDYNLQGALSFFGESKDISSFGGQAALVFKDRGWLSSFKTSLRDYSLGFNPINYSAYLKKVVKNWSFGISHGTSFRAPTLNDLYWPASGNLSLKPEEGVSQSIEAGFKNKIGNEGFVKISARTTTSQFKNQIVWVPNSSSLLWSPTNFAKTYHLTHTLKAKAFFNFNNLKNHIFVSFSNVNANEVGFLETSNQLAYTPKYLVNGGYRVDIKESSIDVNVQYQSQTFLNTYNSKSIDPFLLANVKFSQRIKRDRIKAYLQINNAFNKDYEITQGRPMAPRNLTLGITLKL